MLTTLYRALVLALTMAEDREEHLKLAGIVKGLHADLRKKFKTNAEQFDKVWQEHCSNSQLLDQYASAMHRLATDHWSKLPETRIDWCRDTAIEFFYQGGLKLALEKDEKKRQRQFQKEAANLRDAMGTDSAPSVSDIENNGCCYGNRGDNQASLSFGSEGMHYTSVCLPVTGKLHLLDVGSCFNPFAEFEDFLAVGIDISPAKSTVHRCDFLLLETQDQLQVAPDTLKTYLRNLKSPVNKLPRESFHVVVFSLLLEYFPAAYQRWICCQKAHQLLMVNGLLLIITPDSHKQHRNAPMMKSWRKAIESLGFKRWRYVKQDHIHCMAFRKVVNKDCDSPIISDITPDMIYIPQDFHDLEEEEERRFSNKGQGFSYEESDEEFFLQSKDELPAFLDDSDVW